MEKGYRQDIFLKRLVKDAGMEKPSANFSANVLRSLTERRSIKYYKPLISKKVWIGLGLLYSIGILVFFIFNSDLSLGSNIYLPFPDLGHFQINFPKIELSRTMSYSIALISLFFLQIPFLKHYLDKATESKF